MDGNYLWAINLDYPNDSMGIIRDIAWDEDNNIYAFGSFRNQIDFNPSDDRDSIITSQGEFDAFLAKYDQNGNFIWAFNIGGLSHDEAAEIQLDNDGDIYLVGISSSASMRFGLQDTLINNPDSSRSGYLAKLRSDGTLIWAFLVGGRNYTVMGEFDLDTTGNIYVVGNVSGTVDFDPSENVVPIGPEDSERFRGYLVKYNTNGEYLWSLSLRNTLPLDILIDYLGRVNITGHFFNSTNLDSRNQSAPFESLGKSDIFLGQYDFDGVYISWACYRRERRGFCL